MANASKTAHKRLHFHEHFVKSPYRPFIPCKAIAPIPSLFFTF